MQLFVLLALVCTASAAPQIVPYIHEEIAAEPYIHEEVAAEPYVHIEPALTPEALGQVIYPDDTIAYAAQGVVLNAAPLQPIGYAVAASGCVNNLGAAVPCAQ